MLRKTTTALFAGVGALAAGFVSGAAQAESVAEFYKGRVVTLVIGFGPGGGYDRYARAISSNLGLHLPGKPKVIPQFMTGGGSLRMANYLYNVAPKDGSYIGIHSPVLPMFQLLRSKGFKLDVRKFNYIGRLATQNHVMMVRADHKITSLNDVKKRVMTVSSTGKASPTFILPTIMNNVLGTRFKVIAGYSGSASGRLAMERGEVMGLTSGWISWKATSQPWIDSKYMVPLVEFSLEKSADLPAHVPLVTDLAKTPDEKQILEFIASMAVTGRAVTAPPKVPADRVNALRRAFDAMVKSPAFLASAKKRRIAIVPLTGEKVQELINKTINISPALVKRAQKALGYKD